MDFISGLYNLYLKDRFKEIQNYATEASDIQSEQLSNLLLEASETEMGKRFNFKTIYSYQEFRERLPIQRISDLSNDINRMASGASNIVWPGAPIAIMDSINNIKIPLFHQAIIEIFQKGIGDSYAIHMQSNPDCKLLDGFSVNVGNGERSPFLNELYSILRENEPFLSNLLNLPKRVGKDKDGNPSIELVLQECLGQKVTSFRGTPQRLNAVLSKGLHKTGNSNIQTLWPDAEILFERNILNHVEIAEQKQLIPDNIQYQFSYLSPEGLFGIQDGIEDESLLLMLDLSTFYEFIPIDGDSSDIIPLEDITIDQVYTLVITNCNGLWRCCSEGPKIKFVATNPFRFILI
jgi:hypothetical protein